MSPTTDPVEASAGPTLAELRTRWQLSGVAAAVFGAIATAMPSKVNVQREGRFTTAAVIDTLHRWPYHVGVVAGLIALACLQVTASRWRRWTTERAGQPRRFDCRHCVGRDRGSGDLTMIAAPKRTPRE
jgi:hypothetical protein